MPAITGDLKITTADGTELTATNDLRLAWLWAEHELGTDWPTLTYGEQCAHVAEALAALHKAQATA